ncbi:protein kinase C theta type isoform X1, partial [Silurus asotus]
GLNKQGYQCRQCNAAIHKKCIDKVIAKCTGSAINSKETMVTPACVQFKCSSKVRDFQHDLTVT